MGYIMFMKTTLNALAERNRLHIVDSCVKALSQWGKLKGE